MLVIPAIDLRGGRCVRLVRGDYGRQRIYDDDPVAVARTFAAAGAPRLHVVDLDGARLGRPTQRDLITALAAQVPVPVQVGGGIRDADTAASYLEAGVTSVILGTAALRDPSLVGQLARRYPGRILVSLDFHGDQLAVEGWTATLPAAGATGDPRHSSAGLAPHLEALLGRLARDGIQELIVTDTQRDGTLAGADPQRFLPFRAAGFRVIAAGGVRDLEDIRRLRQAGLWGVIAGRALYEGTLELAAALAVARGEGP